MRLVKFNNRYPQSGNLLNHFFGDELLSAADTLKGGQCFDTPKVNIQENDDAFAIEVAAPGYEKKDFNVTVDNNVLTIEVVKEEEAENKKYSHYEFTYGSFKRSFSLPKDKVNDAKISATYNNGILNVLLPKKEEAKAQPKRLIDIF
ncbi:Hsp20/alpha crystallin family protein [Carboxylicivirga mesophila]|uniref:Hsp20/alpha crystallin family protein n=1 Tax=Carboxylicivirga mesophila TaxID=1166478 RepID=A0ABS5K653_9BACT|nr:Hsp20/alpha crystallin family protein [Carboxylicivirga mesophila]MBS2210463.1 Hsp20/alpha crystallin family protein [Carboxylicivirga mesophila]